MELSVYKKLQDANVAFFWQNSHQNAIFAAR
jgi:hypothetical protein